jgi:hypothetical protein
MQPRPLAFLIAVILSLFVALMIWAQSTSPFLTGCSTIWAEPWGRVMLADLYIGFALFASWIGWRERSWVRGGLWFIALCVLGNLAALAYLVLIAARSKTPDFLSRIPIEGHSARA